MVVWLINELVPFQVMGGVWLWCARCWLLLAWLKTGKQRKRWSKRNALTSEWMLFTGRPWKNGPRTGYRHLNEGENQMPRDNLDLQRPRKHGADTSLLHYLTVFWYNHNFLNTVHQIKLYLPMDLSLTPPPQHEIFYYKSVIHQREKWNNIK